MLIPFVTYASVLIAFIAMLAKAYRYIKAPEHFRWELYPVPHEKGRADYGGSFLEELDWWTKPRQIDMVREIREMMEEVLLLKGVFHHNRTVWSFSLPFHFGLYLCIGWLVLLLTGSILDLAGVEISATAGTFGQLVHYATAICGYAGLVLAAFGAFGLFIWRVSSKAQRVYNSPAEYFNLLIFDVVVAVTLISHLTLDPGFVALRAYVGSLVTFSPPVIPGFMFGLEIVLISLLILYIPLTRMSHFVAKYFLYHSVRWNDEPNERGSKLEKALMTMLNQKVGWSASHIQTGQSWAEVVKEMDNEQK